MPSKSNNKSEKIHILIGITGGIGSGKSLAAHYFELLGYKVINADRLTKELYRTNAVLKAKLVKAFGNGILNAKGFVSGTEARKIIFSSPVNIKRVNKLVHPFVINAIEKELTKINAKIVLIETAIAFESGFYKKLDYMIMVYSSENFRIERVMKRDGAKKEDVEKLISLQMDEKQKLKRSDFILFNSGKKIDLKRSVKDLTKTIETIC